MSTVRGTIGFQGYRRPIKYQGHRGLIQALQTNQLCIPTNEVSPGYQHRIVESTYQGHHRPNKGSLTNQGTPPINQGHKRPVRDTTGRSGLLLTYQRLYHQPTRAQTIHRGPPPFDAPRTFWGSSNLWWGDCQRHNEDIMALPAYSGHRGTTGLSRLSPTYQGYHRLMRASPSQGRTKDFLKGGGRHFVPYNG